MSVMKHVTLKFNEDWSTVEPLYTSQVDMTVASRLDTKGLHLESDETPLATMLTRAHRIGFSSNVLFIRKSL